MRIVVIGGSGLIGRALVDSLAGDGHQAVVASRNPERVRGLPDGAEAAFWDGVEVPELARLLDGAGAVVHLAGETVARRWTAAVKQRIRESRVSSTTALAKALALTEDPPGVLLQGSATGYYGGSVGSGGSGASGDGELDENALPGDDFLAGVCREWEAAGAPAEALGIRRVILRTGVVFARHGGALPRIVLPFRLFAGGPVGSGWQWLPWVHLDDEVGAIRFLLDNETASGPYNLTAPEPVTNKTLAQTLGRILRRPAFLPTPAIALKLLLGEGSVIVLEGQRAVPRRLRDLGYTFRFPTLQGALDDLLSD